MDKKKGIFLITILVDILICLGFLLFFEFKNHPLMHWLDNLLYDNYNHYLKCEELPLIEDIEAVVSLHQDILAQIEQINPGLVGWEVEETCPGRGDILFWYASHANRNTIEGIIGSEDNFFGIPIRLRNQ